MFLYLKKNAYEKAAAREKKKEKHAEAEKAAAREATLVSDNPDWTSILCATEADGDRMIRRDLRMKCMKRRLRPRATKKPDLGYLNVNQA